MANLVYVNGSFVPREEASVDIEDRGYQFADAVYEVIYFPGGHPFRMDEHFQRLKQSADALNINLPDLEQLKQDALELQKKNQFGEANVKLYLQISRGVQKRKHEYDPDLKPNVVMTMSTFDGHPDPYYQEGVKAITVPDDRWARCYIKTTALISNGLAKTKAKNNGAFEAIFIRDGFAMEGTSSNVFIVQDGQVITPPPSNYILNGVTRRAILDVVDEGPHTLQERGISLEELYEADEVFLTGTTTEVMPVVQIDDRTINDGTPGDVAGDLLERYRSLLHA